MEYNVVLKRTVLDKDKRVGTEIIAIKEEKDDDGVGAATRVNCESEWWLSKLVERTIEIHGLWASHRAGGTDTAEKRLRMRETRGKLTIKFIRASVHGLENEDY